MVLFGGIERGVLAPRPIGVDAGEHRIASSDPGTVRRWWPGVLLAGWVAHVVLRLWFAAAQPLPTANPDEIGYLSAARLLAGRGTELDLSGNTFYRGGYGLLLSPLFLLTDHPARLYRLVQVENALIGALLLPLAYVLARRCAASRGTAFLVANAAALLPCAIFFGAFALTDAILPELILGWFLLSHSWLTGPVATRADRIRAAAFGAGAAAVVGLVNTVHSRGAVLVAVHAGLILCAVRFRWGTRSAAAIGAGVLVATMVAGSRLNAAVERELCPSGVRNLGGQLRERFTDPHGWGWLLRIAVGQVWYQLVVTAGLVGIGLILLIVVASRRGTPGPVRALAAAALASVVGIATGTAAALADEHRVGNDAYGRYLSCLTPLLFVLGAVTLLRVERRIALAAGATTAVAMVVGSVVVSTFAGAALTRDLFIRFDFPDLSALTWDWTSLQVWPTTAAGLVLLGGVLAAACSRLQARAALLSCLIGAVGLATLAGDRVHILPEPAALTVLSDAPNEPGWAKLGPSVAIDGNIPWRITMLMQYRKGWRYPRYFNSAPPTDAPLVILAWDGITPAAATWPAGPAANYQPARQRWVAGTGGWVAWTRRDPPAEQPQLRP